MAKFLFQRSQWSLEIVQSTRQFSIFFNKTLPRKYHHHAQRSVLTLEKLGRWQSQTRSLSSTARRYQENVREEPPQTERV
jgi:hypothetical protein